MRKSLKSLPKSPTKKKKTVFSAIATNFGLNMQASQKNTISDEESPNLVRQISPRPDIVFTAPGMKDEVTVWKNGEKIKLRKYYLMTHLNEASELARFRKERINPRFKLSCPKPLFPKPYGSNYLTV